MIWCLWSALCISDSFFAHCTLWPLSTKR